MKKLIIGLFVIGSIAAAIFMAKPGHCVYCPAMKCYDSGVCTAGCVCFKSGGELFGQCGSISNK